MSLFSSRPKNRRRRSRSGKETSWIDPDSTTGGKSPRRATTPKQKEHQLNAQIGAVESFLAKHHAAEVKRDYMKRENILPPPDQSSHRKAKRKMTLAARRRYLAERNRNGLRFLALFCLACGIGWWLIFSGV
tara:strand:- start:183 stop:578 length:396 start_codon:yes stop_codon:yes gene_type:complete